MSLININGQPNLAVAGVHTTDHTAFVQLNNVWSGSLYHTLSYPNFTMISMSVIPQVSGAGVPEPVLLGFNPATGASSVQIRDIKSGSLLKSVPVAAGICQNVYSISDLNGSGNPDLEVLRITPASNTCYVSVADGTTGQAISSFGYSLTGYELETMTVVPNGANLPQTAVIRTNTSTGGTRVCLVDSLSGTQVAAYSVASVLSPVSASVVPTTSGNPQLAIRGIDSSTKNAIIAVNDARTGTLLSRTLFNQVQKPLGLAIFQPAGNVATTLFGVYGISSLTGAYNVQVINRSTGTSKTISVP
jgi:hypothetical protein